MDGRHCPSRGGNRDFGSAFYSLSVSTPPSENLSTLTAPAQPPSRVPSEPQHLSFAKSVFRESSEDTAKKNSEKLNLWLFFFFLFFSQFYSTLHGKPRRVRVERFLRVSPAGSVPWFLPSQVQATSLPNPHPLVSLVASPTGHRRNPPPPKKKPQRECHSASGRAYVKNYPAGAQTQTPVYPFTTRTHYSKRDPNPLPAHSGGMRLPKKRQGLS